MEQADWHDLYLNTPMASKALLVAKLLIACIKKHAMLE